MAETKVKKNKKEEKALEKPVSKYTSVLGNPRITEKANLLSALNIHVFEVPESANKTEIIKAVKDLHKVTPIKVNIAKNPSKKVFFKGRKGAVGGVKKAYIYLKKGDKLQ